MLESSSHHTLPSSNSTPLFLAHQQPSFVPPPWLPQVLLMARFWWQSGLVQRLQTLSVHRGRAGRYHLTDFLLLLLAYAASSLRSFELFSLQLQPFAPLLMSVWQRASCPSPSALSRFLAALHPQELQAIRLFLFQEFLSFGFEPASLGGLFDRVGHQMLFFDLDPTYEAARQRALVSSDEYPTPRRHRETACAPGYKGRKRGQLLCSRLTLQQSHTHEWLDSWSFPGNTPIFDSLHPVCQRVEAYMKHKQLQPFQAILRLDGAYGYPALARIVSETYGLGYLVRCATYGLLRQEEVKQVLNTQTPLVYEQPESGIVREVFDAGVVCWTPPTNGESAILTHLLITRRKHDGVSPVSVGKKMRGWVYELFAMDALRRDLNAMDRVSLYFGRGGFESTLHQEDEECDPGRWLSKYPQGQELFVLMCQHVWNLRLSWGKLVMEEEPQRTEWSAREEDKKAEQSDEFLCAAGIELEKLGETITHRGRQLAYYDAPTEFCRGCGMKQQCHFVEKTTKEGKAVCLVMQFNKEDETRRLEERIRRIEREPVVWEDWRGTRLRREWVRELERQELKIERIEGEAKMQPERERLKTRSERARRRLSWKEVIARNRLTRNSASYRVTFHGLPTPLANWLDISNASTPSQ